MISANTIEFVQFLMDNESQQMTVVESQAPWKQALLHNNLLITS